MRESTPLAKFSLWASAGHPASRKHAHGARRTRRSVESTPREVQRQVYGACAQGPTHATDPRPLALELMCVSEV